MIINELEANNINYFINFKDFSRGHISIRDKINFNLKPYIEKKEIHNGFLNIWLKKEVFLDLEKKWDLQIAEKKRYYLEFGSFNPTGLAHLGNLRNLYLGWFTNNALKILGQKTFCEFYINDIGKQVELFQNSSDYLFGKKILKERNLDITLENMIRLIQEQVSELGIVFDNWKYESSFYENFVGWEKISDISSLLDKVCDRYVLRINGQIRYLEKIDKTTTYLASDILYFIEKKKMNYDNYLMFFGMDNESQVNVLKKLAEEIQLDLHIIFYQYVKYIENGKICDFSKRDNKLLFNWDFPVKNFVMYLFFNSFNPKTAINFISKKDHNFLSQPLFLFENKLKRKKKWTKEQYILLMYNLRRSLFHFLSDFNTQLITDNIVNLYNSVHIDTTLQKSFHQFLNDLFLDNVL